jgi:hypothetical protein
MEDDLRPDEAELIGQWLDIGSRIVADGVAARIRFLTEERLQKLAVSRDKRSTLYRDPADGRLWELSYPYPEFNAGGPPRLCVIAPPAAMLKYGLDGA